jgi:hypothetical protein
LLAATAKVVGLTVATRNSDHFARTGATLSTLSALPPESVEDFLHFSPGHGEKRDQERERHHARHHIEDRLRGPGEVMLDGREDLTRPAAPMLG